MADLQPLLPNQSPRKIPQSVFAPIADAPPVADLSGMTPGPNPLGTIASIAPPPLATVGLDPRAALAQKNSDDLADRASADSADLYRRSHPVKPTTTLGKIGHVAANIGNVLGDIFAPSTMALIPGTQLYNERIMGRDKSDLNQISDLQTAETERNQQAATTAATQETTKEAPGLAASKEALETGQGALAANQAALYKSALNSLSDPSIHAAFQTLSNPKATPEERRSAMAAISESPIGTLPMLHGELSGAENLYRQGELGSRLGGKNIIPDPNSPTGYSTLQYDRFGNPMGLLPVEPSANGQLLLGPQGPQLMQREGSLAGARAAATQAQGLIPIIDPQTNDVIGYASKGSVASATGAGQSGMAAAMAGGLTPAPGTTVKEQGQNAISLQHMITDNIFPAIDNAAKAGDMGPASGRVQDFMFKHIGNPDSPAAVLQAQLQAVPMMLGRMYGYRSAEYIQHMEAFVNLRMTPDAIRAYLDGVYAHAGTIAEGGGMSPKKGATETPHSGGKPSGSSNADYKYVPGKGMVKQ